MTPRSYRPAIALTLVALVLTYVGCSSQNKEDEPAKVAKEATKGDAKGADTAPASDLGPKPFHGWPKPAAALLVSGEQDGYLEPCGCTSGQLGGLRRRFELVQKLHEEQNWPLALVDLGGLIKDPAAARGGPEEAKAKFVVALKALGLLKYNALALSAEDLENGVDEAFAQFLDLGEQPKVAVANVTPASGFEKNVVKSLTTTAGKVKLGITAVIDPQALAKLGDPAKDVLLPEIKPAEEALAGVLPDLETSSDAQVLLVQGPPELAKRLAEKFPGFDIVVSTSHFDPLEEAERVNDGKTMVVSVGHKGQYVGVVGIYPDQQGPDRFRYQRITLNTRYDGPSEPMKKLIEDDLQDMLKQRGIVENFPRRDYAGGAPGATFVGAETCKSCHPKTFAKWDSSKHAHAFESIVKDPKGLRSDHQFDAECISCHTTGFEYNSGWVSAEKTAYLKGNQCENCHGPGSKHIAEPTNADFRKAIARSVAEAEKSGLCARCHDMDNSPKFDFATYWAQINHSKLDKYTDKEKQGIAPKPVAAALAAPAPSPAPAASSK
ncbi:multiheme c-type cytochrome [Singulisphaera sp. PoT]|uniref:multiheme c-type cytochrome n=1 Tax=Singulisphaera sp. PoT TaxID=3411797 RepID=UPI003BF5C257